MKTISLRYLKGIGPRKEAILNKSNIFTVRDLLYYFPFRYEDRRDFRKIKDLKVGELSVIRADIKAVRLKKMPYFFRAKKIKSIFEIILDDNTASIKCVWFNQAYLADTIKVGSTLVIYGKALLTKRGLQIVSPEYELDGDSNSMNVGRIVGVYRLFSGSNQKFIRKIMSAALKTYHADCIDPIPFYIRKDRKILNIAKSLEEMHFPTSWEAAESSRQRFIFEELFFSQILVYLRKAKHRFQKSLKFSVNSKDMDRIRRNLSFKLTISQEKVLSEIINDFSKPYPMHRLLQGDVGCGKTVIAAFAMAVCVSSGHQAVLMVPTEVLAYQHKNTLEGMFRGLSFCSDRSKEYVKVVSSSLSKKEANEMQSGLICGSVKVIIGTHALIQESIRFKNLGLTVIDEQHKFGVAQRALLPKKAKVAPHCLVMSATPIPRSLALSLYGDLDLSVIRELPKGRMVAETLWLKESQREWAYDFLQGLLEKGRQAYIIYPVIEESQDQGLKAIKGMYDSLVKRFSKFSLGMFHGKMASAEKISIIQDFRNNKINILVSTTVVEVGISIDNATAMLVENPERFGLAQLHQLRGRVQRSKHQPHFMIISNNRLNQDSLNRLKIISKETCGFRIAEEDLKLRGPGDFFGSLQHGLPDLKIANPLHDLEILKEARLCAYKIVKSDPCLKKQHHRCITQRLNHT